MIRRFFLTTAIAAIALSASASYTIVYETISQAARTCRITGIENPQQIGSTLNIPSTGTGAQGGFSVVEIASDAIHDIPQVTTIVIPSTIKKIGTNELTFNGKTNNFYNCPKLQRYQVSAASEVFASTSDGLLTSKNGEALVALPQALVVTDYSYTLPSNISILVYDAFRDNSTIRTLTMNNISLCGGNAGLNSMKLLSEIITTATKSDYRAVGGCLINTADSRIVSCPPKKTAGTMSPPGGCSKIGEYAFANCIYLNALSNTYSITEIGTHAFTGSGIKTAIWESKLNYVYPRAFAGCPVLESITFKSVLDYLPDHVASDCPKLTKVTYTAGTPNRMGAGAFANCVSLVEHPFTNFQMGDSCFFNTGFTEVNFVCNTPTEINRYTNRSAFDSCRNLTKIDASGYATTLDKPFIVGNEYASNCPLLAEVRMPAYTEFVQNHYDGNAQSPIFQNVPSLTKIVLGHFERIDHALAPLFFFSGKGLVKPHIYLKNNGLVTSGGTGAPLYKLCATMEAGATIKPIYYWESSAVTSDYADKNAYYYMPGACLQLFDEAAKQGCVNEEFFRLQFERRAYDSQPNCMYFEIKEIYPTMVGLGQFIIYNNGVKHDYLGGKYGNYYTAFNFDQTNSVTINYTVHGEPFATTYDHQFMAENALAGVEGVEIDHPACEAEYFNLQGQPVAYPEAGQIYIVRRGSKVTKEITH